MECFVPGQPVTEGSTRALVTRSGRPVVLHDNPALQRYRTSIAWVAHAAMQVQPVTCDVCVSLHFAVGPTGNHRRLDLDKLTRAVLDALTGIVYKDDAQVAELHCERVAASDAVRAGVWIEVETIPDECRDAVRE